MKETIKMKKARAFKQILFGLLAENVECIESELFYIKCRLLLNEWGIEIKLREFYDLLSKSHCFVHDDGTHGKIYPPRLFVEWNDKFMESL